MKTIFIALCILFSLVVIPSAFAGGQMNSPTKRYPFYVGLITGYGATDWNAIDAHDLNTKVSTPTHADDTGPLFGIFLGYNFTHYFSLEASFIRYSDSKVTLGSMNVYNGGTAMTFYSSLYNYALAAKFIIPVGHTKFHLYSEVGVEVSHRSDWIARITTVGATFGVGLLYIFKKHFLTQLGFHLATGYGKSEYRMLDNFMPFLYSMQVRIGYRFCF